MKKTLLSLLLTVLLGMMSVESFAHNIEVANSDGVTIYYIWTNDNTELSVSYCGDSYNSYSNEYTDNVVIPESVTYDGTDYPVTSIGYRAFYKCTGLMSITIPNSVTNIGREAFYGCSGLTSITIPNSVTKLGARSFEFCSGLMSISIPNFVTTIEDFTFFGCSGLTSITIPNSVTIIGENAFDGCI